MKRVVNILPVNAGSWTGVEAIVFTRERISVGMQGFIREVENALDNATARGLAADGRGHDPDEPADPLDFDGTVYKVYYDVGQNTGLSLESDRERAEAESDILEQLGRRISGHRDFGSITPLQVRLDPAGWLTSVSVKYDGDLTPQAKEGLDQSLDDAVEEVLGVEERAPDDRPEWVVEYNDPEHYRDMRERYRD